MSGLSSSTAAGLKQVARVLRERDRFVVVGHVDPDLDSIGSILGLTEALRSMGKQAVAVSPDPPPPGWSFLPGFEGLAVGASVPFAPEVAVVLDTELSERRLGRSWSVVQQALLRVNVDHHDTNPGTAEVAVVEPRAAATGELVFHLVRELEVPFRLPIATALYAAVLTDTGGFRFANTRAETLRMAAELVDAGVVPWELASRIYDSRPWSYLQLLGRLLCDMQRTEDGLVAWMALPQALVQASGLSHGELEGLVQYPRMAEGVEVALLFRELGPQLTRVSLRSKSAVDVSQVARRFGGGGHLHAAGCTVAAPLEQAVRQVVQEARQACAQLNARSGDGRLQAPDSAADRDGQR